MYSEFYWPSFVTITLFESCCSIYVALLLTGKKYMLPGGCSYKDKKIVLIKFIASALLMSVINEAATDFLNSTLSTVIKLLSMYLIFGVMYYKKPKEQDSVTKRTIKTIALPLLQTVIPVFTLVTCEALFIPLVLKHFNAVNAYVLYKPENYIYLLLCGFPDRFFQFFLIISFWNINLIMLNKDVFKLKALFFTTFIILLIVEVLHVYYFVKQLNSIDNIQTILGISGCLLIFVLNFLSVKLIIKVIQILNREECEKYG